MEDVTGVAFHLTEADFSLIEGLLSEAVNLHIVGNSDAAETHLSEAQALQRSALCESVLSTLRHCVDECAGTSGAQQPVSHESAGGNVDAEVLRLHHQVQQATARVSALRQSVPLLVADAATRQLLTLRPALDWLTNTMTSAAAEDGDAGCMEEERPASAAGASGSATAASPTAAEPALAPASSSAAAAAALQANLAAHIDRLPNLRARLESTMARLTRIVAVIEDDKKRARSPPRTVERALLGGAAWEARQQAIAASGGGGSGGGGGGGGSAEFNRDDGEVVATRKRMLCGFLQAAC